MRSLEDSLRVVDPVDPDAPATDGEPLLRQILASGAPPAAPARAPRGARTGLAAAAVAAVAAALVLATPSGDGPDVVAAAFEAVSQPDTILHYRVQHSTADPGVHGGRQALLTAEVWQAGDGSRMRSIERPEPRAGDASAARSWSETVHTPAEWRTYVAQTNTMVVYDTAIEPLPGAGGAVTLGQRDLGDPRTLLERARRGDAGVTELGEATVRGIQVLQFRLGECRMTTREADGGLTVTWKLPVVVSVARDDQTPVRIAQDNRCGDAPRPENGPPWDRLSRGVADYIDFETLPATAENRKLLEMRPHPGATLIDGEEVDAAEERDESGPRPRPTPTPTPTR